LTSVTPWGNVVLARENNTTEEPDMAARVEDITWDLTTETIQTILTHLTPTMRDHVLDEMQEQDPEQYALARKINDSSHQQEGW
jgi:hypothetical protein